ncbi:LPS assembly lipoprotein LptE [Brackiella oedipodis]|uniref:LPS-assembly lipoprotein LptE n=1 Tax=Brackiella oedipodis TaxID=124225 RepID=UPI0006869F51|nr:LPS assembly lipoprotein LptE [Brackiella oedipodis]
MKAHKLANSFYLSWHRAFILLMLVSLSLLSACGFHLRGTTELPFKTVATNINKNSEFGNHLLRRLKATSPNTDFVAENANADVIFHEINSQAVQREMSLDDNGRVSEYELSYIYQFQLTDRSGQILLPPTEIITHHLLPYDEDQSDADGQLQAYLYKTMSLNIADQIVRYVTAPKVIQRYRALHGLR